MAKGDSTRSTRGAASPVCGERRVKVYSAHYDYRKREQPQCSVNRPVPWVQLKGYWLERVGFNIHTPIQVRVMNGCLVLTVLGKSQEE